MKTALSFRFFTSLAFVLCAASAAQASAVAARIETTLLSCSTMKWTSVELNTLSVPNPSRPGSRLTSYELVLSKGSRDRQSVGIYTESRTPIFFTANGQKVNLNKKSNGEFELIAEFTGAQPMNASAVKLVGNLNAEKELEVRLLPGKTTLANPAEDVVESTHSFDFFKSRWDQFIKNEEVLSDATLDYLICAWQK